MIFFSSKCVQKNGFINLNVDKLCQSREFEMHIFTLCKFVD